MIVIYDKDPMSSGTVFRGDNNELVVVESCELEMRHPIHKGRWRIVIRPPTAEESADFIAVEEIMDS